ncbi:hypothetical protein WANA13_1030 [Wolbachia endosymbiont of Drosophila ananassae]|nr:hypothetical protein WANA13_1030 [Wolbachia endosymbiont of Drosophila ananassae]
MNLQSYEHCAIEMEHFLVIPGLLSRHPSALTTWIQKKEWCHESS